MTSHPCLPMFAWIHTEEEWKRERREMGDVLTEFSDQNGGVSPAVWKDKNGVTHRAVGADVVPYTLLLWTACGKSDIPANGAWIQRAEDIVNCDGCSPQPSAQEAVEESASGSEIVEYWQDLRPLVELSDRDRDELEGTIDRGLEIAGEQAATAAEAKLARVEKLLRHEDLQAALKNFCKNGRCSFQIGSKDSCGINGCVRDDVTAALKGEGK